MMYKRIALMLLVCALVLACAPLWAAQTAAAAPAAADAGEAAVAYSNALALANTTRAWNLLSAQSRQGLTEAQWRAAFEKRPAATAKPPASALLRPLANSAQPPTLGEALVRGDEALVSATTTVQITQAIVLVQEGTGWRVDLAASDQANAREAAQSYLDAIREDTNAASPQGRRSADASLPLLRTVLRPEARNFHVVKTEVTGNRATVVVGADLPVSLVLRGVRSGAGWTVDFARPLAQVDILSPNPLKEAVAASETQACQDQLRQIYSGIQMYASTSADMLPDPKRWVDQISRTMPQPPSLHCVADPTPGVSYAYNSNLAGKKRSEIGNPAMVPMVFESTAHRPDAADNGTSWPASPWHEGGIMVLYADGSVRATPTKPSFEVPPAPPGGAMRPGMAGRPRPGTMSPGAMAPGAATPAPVGRPAPVPRPPAK